MHLKRRQLKDNLSVMVVVCLSWWHTRSFHRTFASHRSDLREVFKVYKRENIKCFNRCLLEQALKWWILVHSTLFIFYFYNNICDEPATYYIQGSHKSSALYLEGWRETVQDWDFVSQKKHYRIISVLLNLASSVSFSLIGLHNLLYCILKSMRSNSYP